MNTKKSPSDIQGGSQIQTEITMRQCKKCHQLYRKPAVQKVEGNLSIQVCPFCSSKWYTPVPVTVLFKDSQPKETMQNYLEIIDTRSGDARKTGIISIFKDEIETRKAFISAGTMHTANGPFCLDMYINGNLEETIHLTEDSVEAITGVKVESVDVYIKYDEDFWERARQLMQKNG